MVQTKKDLIDVLVDRNGMKLVDAQSAVKAVLDFIQESLEDGDSVQITGFGTFSVKNRPERKGRNPKTGESMIIPKKTIVVFKPGKSLRDAV